MRFAVFGLSITSSWGNGHATLLRGLFRELHRNGHHIDFFERDVPYYAGHRDATEFAFTDLHLYGDWSRIEPLARDVVQQADAAIITSYCPDGRAAGRLVLGSNASRKVFYDMDTPVTLARLERGEPVEYLPASSLAPFDLVLSYTGGRSLQALKQRLGARHVAPLYGWVDADVYQRTDTEDRFRADSSYLGTYAADRHQALDRLFLTPAARLPKSRFLIGGAMYPDSSSWPGNVRLLEHVPQPDHAAFYSSSPLTLNVTRASMAAVGYCPSGRLFEAAACGTAILSDWWEGLDTFFTPGEEILIAKSTEEALAAMELGSAELKRVGARARERTLECHTAALRARELEQLLQKSSSVNETAQASAAGSLR